MSGKKDTLWWAVKRDDRELAARLMTRRQTKGEQYNIKAAATLAIHQQSSEMLQIIVPTHDLLQHFNDNRDWIVKHKTFHVFEPIFAQLNFPNLSLEEQYRHLSLILSFSNQPLSEQWINQIDPAAKTDYIGNKILKYLKNSELFLIWYERCVKHRDDKDLEKGLCFLVMESECSDIWTQQPHWGQLMLEHKIWSKIKDPDLLSLVWDALPKCAIDDMLTEPSTLDWAINQGKLGGEQKMLALNTALQDILEVGTASSLKTIWPHLDHQTKENAKSTSTSQNETSKLFIELCEFEQTNPTRTARDIQWKFISSLNWIDNWIATEEIEYVMPWVGRLSDQQNEQLIVTTAQLGRLDDMIALIDLGIENPFETLILHAAAHGRGNVVSFFLDQGVASGKIKEACFWAVRGNHVNVLMMLYPHLDDCSRQKAFDNAVSDGHLECVEFLIKQGLSFDLNNLDWVRWIKYAIDQEDDKIFEFISSIIPHHPANAELFGLAVDSGMLAASKSLLNKFDHSTYSFRQLLNGLISNGCSDLKMIELIMEHSEHRHIEELIVGDGLYYGQPLIFEEIIERSTNSKIFDDALWHAIHHNKSTLVGWLLKHADIHRFQNSFLSEAARKNNAEIIDLIFPFYRFEEIEKTAQLIYVDPAFFRQWHNLYFVKKYNALRKRKEIDEAVAEEGQERSRRLM